MEHLGYVGHDLKGLGTLKKISSDQYLQESRYVLRKGLPLHSDSKDGIGTLNPREGSRFLGIDCTGSQMLMVRFRVRRTALSLFVVNTCYTSQTTVIGFSFSYIYIHIAGKNACPRGNNVWHRFTYVEFCPQAT